MSLSLALSSALSGLSLTKRGTQTVADNIANANTKSYGVREVTQAARSVGSTGNGVAFTGISRQVDHALVAEWRDAASQKESTSVLGQFWQTIETGFGVPGEGGSLSDRITEFTSTLERARLSPDQPALLQQVKQAAIDITSKVRGIDASLQQERDRADGAIAREVDWLNTSLDQIAGLNKEIQRQTILGGSPEALMDSRQALIDQVATRLPIREFPREDGRILLMSQDGTILVDNQASKFGFTRTIEPSADERVEDNALSRISVNGREIGPQSEMFSSGQIGALLDIRDVSAPRVQEQLDGLTADLINRFAAVETDPLPPAGTFGLFSLSGETSFTGTVPGMSGQLELNPAAQAEPWRIKAGISATAEAATLDNTVFSRMVNALEQSSHSSAFPSVRRDVQGHVTDILSAVGTQRLALDQRNSSQVAKFSALDEALAAQGVDKDAELSKLLILEQAYAANARVLATVDAMIRTLLEI